MSRILNRFAIVAALLSAAGCSWQQAYTTAQNWQRNQCYRLVEQTERERCVANAATSYDDYRKSTAPAAKG